MTLFADQIRQDMDQGKLTREVSVDLQKAFDAVEHSILLLKLPYYGIKVAELMWMKRYLTARSQFVQCGSAKSESRIVKLGVLHGSILGPLLFLMHVDDLTRTRKDCKIQIYADDTVISFSHENANILKRL